MSAERAPAPLLLFAALLEYPGTRGRDPARECADAVRAESPEAAALLTAFAELADRTPRHRMEELYTSALDFDDRAQPYLGGHLFGESYKRSLFLIGLSERYRQHGFERGQELADHIAVVLRFLAHAWGTGDAEELVSEGLLPALGKIVAGLGPAEEQEDARRGRDVYGLVLRALECWLSARAGQSVATTSVTAVSAAGPRTANEGVGR